MISRILRTTFAATLLTTAFPPMAALAAETVECLHCAKHLLPTPIKLIPGRKYARDRRVDMQHLRLEVLPDFAKRSITATATLTFKPIALPLQHLELDAVDLLVSQIEVKGADLAEHQMTGEKLVLDFAKPIPAGQEVVLRVSYSVEPRNGLYFRTPEMGYKAGDTQLWTQGEAELHRFWFPCYDYPNERFTSEILCTVPQDMEVVSNGSLVEKIADGNLIRWHWRQDKPHVNYLVALAAGHFFKIEEKAGEIPLAMLVPPSEKDQAAAAFADTRKIIEFYQKEIGVPFAWDKYYQVYCHDFLAGGMENTSCTFEASSLLFSTTSEELRSLHRLDAHETAHQWFGDLVTCRDWSHLWLNEGFASYYTVLYEESKLGHDAMLYAMWEEAEDVFRAKDRRPTVWRDYQDPMQQFDSRVYPRGAWILHMMRSRLGPDLYRKCIRTYLERHRNGIVGTDDLQDVVEELSGLSFDQFFDQWLYHGSFPELDVQYSWDAKTKLAKITIKQTHKTDDQVRIFGFSLPIRFTLSGGKETRDAVFEVNQTQEDFYCTLPSQPELVRIDPDYTLLAKIQFKPPGDMLDRQLKSDVIGRLLALQQFEDKKDATSATKVAEVLKSDPFHAVRSAAAGTLAKMATPEALTALLTGVEQKDARVRKAVVTALSAFPQTLARDQLWKMAGTEKNPEILAAIIQTWGARPGEDAVANALRQHLESATYQNGVANAAISALKAHNDASAVPLILRRIQRDPQNFRSRDLARIFDDLAFLARNDTDKTTVRSYLVSQLSSARQELQVGAAKALGTLRDVRSIAALEALIAGESTFVDPLRDAASKALQELRSYDASPPQLKQLVDQIQQLQKKAETMQTALDDLKKKQTATPAK